METPQQILTDLPTDQLKNLQRELHKLETSEGWGLLVKYLDSDLVTSVARLAVPAEGVDSLVKKEYFNGCIATALRLQGAPQELYGVIENELDSRTKFEGNESEE